MGNVLQAILTGATCGATCWYAKEEICRCSCGGKNHGCMLDEDGGQPERTAKIDGVMYRLEAVGSYSTIWNLAQKALKQLGWLRIETKTTYTDGVGYHLAHDAGLSGSAIRVRPASENQKKWPEVKASGVPTNFTAYLLWMQVDPPEPLWCEDTECWRCAEKRVEIWSQHEDETPEIDWDFGEDDI